MRTWTLVIVAAVTIGVAASLGAADRVYRIGIITFAGAPPTAVSPDGGGPMPIKDLLAERGYKEGDNVVYMFRASGRDQSLTDRQAREMVAWKPDLVIGQMTNADIAIAKAAAGTKIPIVIWSTDPVEAGVVKSFTKPGTNVTGFAYEPYIEMLQLRILKTVLPGLKHVGHLYNHTYAPAPAVLRRLKEAAAMMGIDVTVHETLTRDEFEKAFVAMKAEGAAGVVIGPHELFNTSGDILGALSLKYGLPIVGCCQVSIARGGGLASYSPPNGWPAMADRIDQILKGKATPQDFPIIRSIASPLTLNLKSAAVLGLTVPESLIEEASQVIR